MNPRPLTPQSVSLPTPPRAGSYFLIYYTVYSNRGNIYIFLAISYGKILKICKLKKYTNIYIIGEDVCMDVCESVDSHN